MMWETRGHVLELSCSCGGTLRAPYVVMADKLAMIDRFHAAHEVCRQFPGHEPPGAQGGTASQVPQ